MGRSQVKYRSTHGRGRGRGGGGRGGETAGAEASAPPSSRRSGGGGGGGRRPLESNAFRFEEHQDELDDEGEDGSTAQEGGDGGQPRSFRRQFFAGEESVREIGAAPSGAYFESQTMKQWDADDDDEPLSAKSAMGVMDFNWIGEQLAKVPPSVRYQMDPQYCADFDFEPQTASESDPDEQTHDDDESAPAAAAAATSADSELDVLLQLSSTTISPAQPAAAASSVSAGGGQQQQQQQQRTDTRSDQLEDWLDDVLDM